MPWHRMRIGAGQRFRDGGGPVDPARAGTDGGADAAVPPQQQMLPIADQTTAPAAPAAEQKFGEQPPDRSHEFLRKQDVLLHAGQWQFDVGFQYLIFTHDYTQSAQSGSLISAVDSRETRRLMVCAVDCATASATGCKPLPTSPSVGQTPSIPIPAPKPS